MRTVKSDPSLSIEIDHAANILVSIRECEESTEPVHGYNSVNSATTSSSTTYNFRKRSRDDSSDNQNTFDPAIITAGITNTTRAGAGFAKEQIAVLKGWLLQHTDEPYPTESEKKDIMEAANITLRQLNDWLSNARRRILRKKKIKFTRPSRSCKTELIV